MKRCPECKRDYYDDTLLYCLDDGNPLLEGPASANEPATAILSGQGVPSESATRPQIHTTEQTAVQPSGIGEVPKAKGFDKRLILGPLALAVFVLGGFFGYRYITPAKQIASIAVMPLVNSSDDADSEYLSDGMTETLINSLAQLPDLAVKGRGSVFRYKGKDSDPKQIATELGVDAVLNGRLLKRGDSVTLSLDLVEAATGNQIWGEQYVRGFNEIASLQKEIARDVSNKLKAKLSGADQQNIAKGQTANSEAYQLYLQGLYQWNKRTFEGIEKAKELFQKAIDKDPNYALAHAGLASSHVVSGGMQDDGKKAKAAALKALEIDPSLGEAHTVLANVAFYQEWDPETSEREFKKAIELSPNYATSYHWYGETLSALGRFDEANAALTRAVELDPVSLAIATDQGFVYYTARQFDRAIEHFKRLIEIDPTFQRSYFYLAANYDEKRMFPEAIEARRKGYSAGAENNAKIDAAAKRLSQAYAERGEKGYWQASLEQVYQRAAQTGQLVDEVEIAFIYAKLGDIDKAFEWLDKGYKARRTGMVFLKADPGWENIRSDPRFDDLVHRVTTSRIIL